jgi:hypothetical protein
MHNSPNTPASQTSNIPKSAPTAEHWEPQTAARKAFHLALTIETATLGETLGTIEGISLGAVEILGSKDGLSLRFPDG